METPFTLTAQILLIHVTWTFVSAYPNLATQTTIQSTTFERSNGVRLSSSLAVDGSRNKDGYATPYCAATLLQTQSWWKVQLVTSSHINEIRIWLRNDSWGRIQPMDYNIYLSDSGTCGTGTLCVRKNLVDEEMTVTCADTGQWVVICGYIYTDMVIALCEVEIYGCPKEKYGDECLHQCGNCLDSYCSLANGSCPQQCRANYWGDKCSKACPDKCSNQACRQSDGICTDCVSGYWGDMCSNECPDKCSACRQNNGKCTGCVSGYWGDMCTNECPDGCDEQGCIQFSGVCFDCDDGHWGENCSKSCPNCKNNVCDKTNGMCLHGCFDDSFWGTHCKPCPDKCAGDICEANGDCFNCLDGYTGIKCQDKCPNQCFGNRCEQTSSSCLKGCADGWWGERCTEQCPVHCAGNTCEQETRVCHGCVAGYWSTRCNEVCSSSCVDTMCNQYDATCIVGLISSNQEEDKCEKCETCEKCEKCETCGVDIVAGAVGVVIGVLALIMVMLIFLLRRRHLKKNKPKATTDSTHTMEVRGGTDMYHGLSSNRDVNDYDSITTVT